MKLPVKRYQYALVDAAYNFHYVDNGGVNKMPFTSFDNTPHRPFLPQHPVEWKAFEVSFEMNEKYWMSKRAYSVPLTFIGDGAAIIRNKQFLGRGYSEELYMLLLVKNDTTGAYDLECKLQIDFTPLSNDPVRGVRVNAIEGGVVSYLNSRDTQTYELTIDESNPAAIKVRLDGVTFEDTFNFQFVGNIPIPMDNTEVILPTVFINNEGFNVGVIHGDQSYEDTGGSGYGTSANYIFQSIFGVTGLRIYGIFKHSPPAAGPATMALRLVTSAGTYYDLLPYGFYTAGTEYPFDVTINLAAGEKLFITAYSNIVEEILSASADFKMTFQSRNVATECFVLRPLDAWKQLVSIMTDGKYTGDSAFLTLHNNIALTCGDALRNTLRTIVPNYKAAMSVEDYFTSYSSFYNLGIKAVGDVLWLEPKSALFKPDVQIFDLGEVNECTIDVASDKLISGFKCGYPDQNYDSTSASSSGGKYEFNSTQQWSFPTTAVNKFLDVTSKFRADIYGIESIRGGLLNKDTTDNQGDKQVFLINIGDATVEDYFAAVNNPDVIDHFAGAQNIFWNTKSGPNFDWVDAGVRDSLVFTGDYQTANIVTYMQINYGGGTVIGTLFKNGISLGSVSSIDTDGVQVIPLVLNNIPIYAGDVFNLYIIPMFGGTLPPWDLVSCSITFNFLTPVYTVTRAPYTSITGVIDNTVYNVEEMTPHRQLLAWMPYLASLGYQQPADAMKLTTAAKNTALTTTLAGVTINEAQDEILGNYTSQALFLPYVIRFRTKVPLTFEQLSAMGTGYIKITFNGISVYGLPFGKLTSKPETRESQEWELLAAPNNLLSDFLKLSTFGLTLTTQDNVMFISDYNPVQWVKYAYTPQSKYHQLHEYDDWSYNRFNRYIGKPVYFQKWQTSDLIKMQFLVAGIPGLNLFIYDCAGKEYGSPIPLTPTANTAVPSPFVLYQGALSLSTFAPNRYLFVIKSAAGQNLAISEWQDIRVDQPKTVLIEYSNTYNKPNMFFNSIGQMMFRIEGIFGVDDFDADFFEFVDETGDIEMLNGIPTEKELLVIGDPYGVPSWGGKKINIISILNQVFYDGKQFSRDEDAKLQTTVRAGYKYNKYAIELRPAENTGGLEVIAEEEILDEDITSFMLNQQAIGMNGEGTLDVDITNT